uniref:G_PROTEIN_RECEP_F1_2 domain-containing protein n=1 Tax=Steinernema glaseri TaxID=37863 RepID=A0A1I7ZX71_9BILA
MHFRTWNSPNRAMKAIATAYIVPAVFYVPYAIGRYSLGEKKLADGTTVYMTIDSEASKTFQWQVYKWTREGLLRFAPLIVLSILNFRIMLAFRKRQQMFARLTNRKDHQVSSSKDDTLLYMLGGIVAMFFICNIPAAINLLFINETVKKRVDYQIFRAVANLLEITNHAAQFYVFCACSTDYRTTFLLKFPCFKANYAGRARSFIRRGQQSCKSAVGGGLPHIANNSSIVDNGFRQLTYSTGACDSGGAREDTVPMKGPFSIESLAIYAKEEISMIENDSETGDIHLASGEEDFDSDFEFGMVAELTVDANGSTHL